MKLSIKKGLQLTQKEIDEVNQAKGREWKLPPVEKKHLEGSLYFHLRDKKGNLLSLGQAITIPAFKFNSEKFSILGIGGIISNIKGKGYGKLLMRGIKTYLEKHNLTGVGFCDTPTGEFYKKSGFNVVPGLTKRFVYYKKGKRITNNRENRTFYFDGKNRFIEKVLKEKDKEVVLSREPDW